MKTRCAFAAAAALILSAPPAARAGMVTGEVTIPADAIAGLTATTAGGANHLAAPSTDYGGGGAFSPSLAIDDNVGTKHLNTNAAGVNTGFVVTPHAGPVVVRSIEFFTANNSPALDPFAITVEGSNDANARVDAEPGPNFTVLYQGTSGLTDDPGRTTGGVQVAFPNSTAYTSYRVLVTATRTLNAGGTQYSEALLSSAVPEPAALSLAALAGSGLLARRRAGGGRR